MLDLRPNEIQRAVADTVDQFVEEHDTAVIMEDPGTRLGPAWSGLGELGVFGLGSAYGEGGMLEAAAALERLGAAAFPGPLAASFLATQVLDQTGAADVAEGKALVAFGPAPLIPWAGLADIILSIADENLVLAKPKDPIEEVSTVGGEPCGRCQLETVAELATGDAVLAAFARYDTAIAAYASGLAGELVRRTVEHVAARRQFGRTLGEFQAVAHPLADCSVAVSAASTLAARAAFAIDHDDQRAPRLAAVAWTQACAAALETAAACHQAFGAMSITVEGPVWGLGRRIRQMAGQESYRQECLAELMIEPLGL